MIGLFGVCQLIQTNLATSMVESVNDINTRLALVDRDLIPIPRTVFVDDRPTFQTGDLPAVIVIPQATLSIRRTDSDASEDNYMLTYEVRVYVTTEIVGSYEAAARQRMMMILALREALLLNQELGVSNGEVRLDAISLRETYGPIVSRPHSRWYAESYVTVRVNTVESLSRIPKTGTPITPILVVDLNTSQPYQP